MRNFKTKKQYIINGTNLTYIKLKSKRRKTQEKQSLQRGRKLIQYDDDNLVI